MDSAIERLRASKQTFEVEQAKQGKEDGLAWAKDDAEYGELKAVAGIALSRVLHRFPRDQLFKALADLLDSDYIAEEMLGEKMLGGVEPSDEYVRGFIEGAREFFESVEGQL